MSTKLTGELAFDLTVALCGGLSGLIGCGLYLLVNGWIGL